MFVFIPDNKEAVFLPTAAIFIVLEISDKDKPITLDDIEANDPDLHKSLNWMLNNNIQDIIDTSFSVEHEAFGVIRVHELKPGGKNIPVRFFLNFCNNILEKLHF